MRAALVLLHRYVGLAIAGFLVVAGLTGSVLAFRPELDAWLNPDLFHTHSGGGVSLSPSQLAAVAERADPNVQAYAIILPEKPGESALVEVGPGPDASADPDYDQVFIDPATGRILGRRMDGAFRLDRQHLIPFLHRFHYLSADGAIVSDAADMGAYARMLLARGATPAGRLISARAFDRFATAALDDYGYGIDVMDGGQVLAHSGSIAGFQAYLTAYVDEGFAIVFLSNGPLDKALRERISARLSKKGAGEASPPASTAWPEPASFVGRFVDADGRERAFQAGSPGELALVEGDVAVPLTRLGKQAWGLYLTPTGPRAFLFFRDAAGAVTDVSEGVSGYTKRGSGHPYVATLAAYHPLVGRYAAHGEEGPGVRVFVRGGQLMMAYADASSATPLIEDAPRRFRFAKPAHAPEWLAFDTLIDGKAQRLMLSGVPLYRIDLP